MNLPSFYPLIFDTGCLVLIWLVQLVIYPSFKFYDQSGLQQWHSRYTKSVSFVVVPLMVGQLLLGIWSAIAIPSPLSVIKLALILSTWLTTFIIFVPLHKKLEHLAHHEETINNLVKRNWIRTVLWSLVFVLSLLQSLIP